MSPVNSHERPLRKDLMINGLRPSPLKISKGSHFIQQPPAGVVSSRSKQQQHRQGPIIIYTDSPKIIHTQAQDFMALVQKLTGFSRSDQDNETAPSRPRKNKANVNSVVGNYRQEENDSSSALTDENGGSAVAGTGDVNNVSSSYVPTTISPANPFFADIPLFTPNSSDFFYSPRPVYKFTDNAVVSPTLGTLNSPSLLEFMKGLLDY